MVVLRYFTWVLSVLTPHSGISIMRIAVSIAVVAAAIQKSLLSSKTVQMCQKDWTTSSTKCTTAGVRICNWGWKEDTFIGAYAWWLLVVEIQIQTAENIFMKFWRLIGYSIYWCTQWVCTELHSAPPGFCDILCSSLTVVPQSLRFSHARFTSHTCQLVACIQSLVHVESLMISSTQCTIGHQRCAVNMFGKYVWFVMLFPIKRVLW